MSGGTVLERHPKLAAMAAAGQSVWLDYIDRALLETGELERLVALGVTGVTTNPTIFRKAIGSGERYDASIRHWVASHGSDDTEALLEHLMVEDVRAAADLLYDVHDRTGGEDGYVSIEVSPLLAHDPSATLAAAGRLVDAVGRPNLMVKIPGTRAGLQAIERGLAAGYNVNVTLLFAPQRYAEVLEAYRRARVSRSAPAGVASVASFFVSRIDTKVDGLLDRIGTPAARALRGRAAIVSARQAWNHLTRRLESSEFSTGVMRDARIQRLLWGSTSSKDPAYPDLKYVEALIGPHTVDTLPPATLDALLDHGRVEPTLHFDPDGVEAFLDQLAEVGVDLEQVTAELEREGVEAFADSWRELIGILDRKRSALA